MAPKRQSTIFDNFTSAKAGEQPMRLAQGSSGNEVSQMQQILKNYGFYGGIVDGKFGPKTQKAISDFQKVNGIGVDGIIGPETAGKLQNWSQNNMTHIVNNPAIQDLMTKDPTVKKTVEALSNGDSNQSAIISAAAELGTQNSWEPINDVQGMQRFFDIANERLSPELNEQLGFYRGDFQDAYNKEIQDYKNTLGDKKEQARRDIFDYDDSTGRSGSFMFSEPARRREELINTTNRDFDNTQRSSASRLSNLARNYEQTVGSSELNDYDFRQNRGKLNSMGVYGQSNKTAYTPMGGVAGSLRDRYRAQLGSQAAGLYGQGVYGNQTTF